MNDSQMNRAIERMRDEEHCGGFVDRDFYDVEEPVVRVMYLWRNTNKVGCEKFHTTEDAQNWVNRFTKKDNMYNFEIIED